MPVTSEAAQRAAFIANLRSEREAFAEFRQILQTEQATLLNAEIDTLVHLAHGKSEKVTRISQLAEQRNQQLVNQGFPPSRLGMSQWIVAFGGKDSDEVSRLWRELLEIAAAAQELNRSNGAMIETRLRNNQQALAVLQAAANQSGFYGPDGQTHWYGLGRQLGEV